MNASVKLFISPDESTPLPVHGLTLKDALFWAQVVSLQFFMLGPRNPIGTAAHLPVLIDLRLMLLEPHPVLGSGEPSVKEMKRLGINPVADGIVQIKEIIML